MRFRSFLFTPANRLDRLERATSSEADVVILDLEDGVPAVARSAARGALQAAFETLPGSDAALAIRVNPLTTADGFRDAAMLLELSNWPQLICLPKVETAKEVEQFRNLAASVGQDPWIMVTLESALALADPLPILRGAGLKILAGYGSGDHTAETGAAMSRPGLSWGRGQIINAAGAAGCPVIDGVCPTFNDDEALEAEAQLGRELGFSGKIAIHPKQVPIINAVFTPTEDEVDRARRMIAVSEATGGGAFAFEGKMVDGPVLDHARRVLAASGLGT